MTVPQTRHIPVRLLGDHAPGPEEIAAGVGRVLRYDEEVRIYHRCRATGGSPPRRSRMHTDWAVSLMAGQLAIIAYRALVGGVPSGTVDIQVRWFADQDAERVRRSVESAPASSYRNRDNEVVYWEFSEVLAIEPFDPRGSRQSGAEVIGFIASAEELLGLA